MRAALAGAAQPARRICWNAPALRQEHWLCEERLPSKYEEVQRPERWLQSP